MKRELRIDIVRGIAIVTILLNHFAMAYRAVGYRGWEIPTPTQLGYSSAASIFVALSGYMVGMVYMRKPHPIRAVLKRAGDLYLVNLAMFLLVLPAAPFVSPARDRFWNMQDIVQNPLLGIFHFLTLQDAPAFLDVLQLYIVLLLMTPLAIVLVRRSPWLLTTVSVSIWAGIQLWPFVLPHENPVPSLGRSLNPLAWQMVFFLPMLAGMKRLHEPLLSWLSRNRWIVIPLLATLFVFAYLHEIDRPFAPWPIHLALTDRFAHGPIWTVHALVLLLAYLALLTVLTATLQTLPFRLLASLGRNSLNVYAASIPTIFLFALLIGAHRLDSRGMLVGTALTVTVCLVVAALSDRRKGRRRRQLHSTLPT